MTEDLRIMYTTKALLPLCSWKIRRGFSSLFEPPSTSFPLTKANLTWLEIDVRNQERNFNTYFPLVLEHSTKTSALPAEILFFWRLQPKFNFLWILGRFLSYHPTSHTNQGEVLKNKQKTHLFPSSFNYRAISKIFTTEHFQEFITNKPNTKVSTSLLPSS